MDDNDPVLSGAPARGLWNVMAKGTAMEGFPRGVRVHWGSTETKAIGTVVHDSPDREGLILVRWDGIGTYKEDPINLRHAPEAAR